MASVQVKSEFCDADETTNATDGDPDQSVSENDSSAKSAPTDKAAPSIFEDQQTTDSQSQEAAGLEQGESGSEVLALTHLPEVVLVNVMEYLSLRERYHLSLTCSLFYDLFSHPQLWQTAHIVLLTQEKGERSSRNPFKWKLQAVMHHTMATIVQKFSHLFQHLSLELHNYVQPFDKDCKMLLEQLNTECRLESLSLKLGPLTSTDVDISRVSVRLSNYADLPLVVGLIKNATRLKRLSLVSWPLLEKTEDNKDIFEALLVNQRLAGLESLNLFFPELKNRQWTDRIPKLPSTDLTLKTVSHLRNISHLSLRSPMLSDQLILELAASKKRAPLLSLQILVMYSRDSVLMEGFKVPEISAQAWSTLRKSSPQLRVEYFVFNRVPQEQLGIMLQKEVQLSAISILSFGRCDAELITVLAERYRGTLRKFVSYCDSPLCDEALLKLVDACDLTHLVYHGDVSYKTIEKIAALVKDLGMEMECFEFKEKNIKTEDTELTPEEEDIVVARDEASKEYYLASLRSWHRDEDERMKRIDAMSEHVSQCLGYNWRPVDK